MIGFRHLALIPNSRRQQLLHPAIHESPPAFLSIFAVLLLASCASSDSALNRQLLNAAETNPKPTAILGMWHRNANEFTYNYRTSVLFRADGSGMESYFVKDPVFGEEEHNDPFKWTYRGNGVWKAGSPLAHESDLWTLRMSGGKLLRNSGYPWFYAQIFERVPE